MILTPEDINKAYNHSQGQFLREQDKDRVVSFARAIIAAYEEKLRGGVELPEPYGYLAYDPRFQSQDFIEGELDGDFEGQEILPLIAPTGVIQYGDACALAAREQVLKEAAALDWTAIMREGSLVTRGDAGTLGFRVVEQLRALAASPVAN